MVENGASSVVSEPNKPPPDKKDVLKSLKFRSYQLAGGKLPPPTVKSVLKNKFKSLRSLGLRLTEAGKKFQRTMTLGFDPEAMDFNDDWKSSEKFQTTEGKESLVFQAASTESQVRIVPRLVKQMILRDVPVELAMHKLLLVGILDEFADFTENDVTVEWPNGVYQGSVSIIVKSFKLIPNRFIKIPAVDKTAS